MHYIEYNQVCSKCDRPIEYKELGGSIIITPCPCQTVELVEALQLAIEWFEGGHGEPGQIGCKSLEEIKQALANATK